jgi:hypothetical protein
MDGTTWDWASIQGVKDNLSMLGMLKLAALGRSGAFSVGAVLRGRPDATRGYYETCALSGLLVCTRVSLAHPDQ